MSFTDFYGHVPKINQIDPQFGLCLEKGVDIINFPISVLKIIISGVSVTDHSKGPFKHMSATFLADLDKKTTSKIENIESSASKFMAILFLFCFCFIITNSSYVYKRLLHLLN